MYLYVHFTDLNITNRRIDTTTPTLPMTVQTTVNPPVSCITRDTNARNMKHTIPASI